MRSVGGWAVVAWVLVAPGLYGCGKSTAPAADGAAATAPSVTADAAATAPSIVADAAATAPPVEDSAAAVDVALTHDASDVSSNSNAAAEVEPAEVEPAASNVDHCALLMKAIAAELEMPLPPAACAITLTLDEPRVAALLVRNLPSVEGEWMAVRIAVASGGRWFATPYAGSRVLSVTRLEAGPVPGYFHFVVRSRWSEPGAGTSETEALHVCRVPPDAGDPPRCADKVVRGRFEPLPPDPDDDGFVPGQAEDWQAPWRLTADGVVFGAVTGKYSPETERPAEGTVGLADFLSSGVDLAPE